MAKAKSPWGTLGKKRGLPGLPGMRRKRRAEDNVGTLEKFSEAFDLVDNELAEIERALGDRGRAKRVLKIKREQYPNATLPELVCIEWLQRRSIEFLFQQGLLGGRLYKGGVVPDLIVYQGSDALVWAVQGNYWHQRPGMEGRDTRAYHLIMGLQVYGHRITAVVAVWERRILADTDGVLNAALMGIEQGQ